MRPLEAVWLGERLAASAFSDTILDLGASTPEFRRLKPHIDEYIYAPLSKRGVRIVTCDLKDAPGVDVVGDILEPRVQMNVRAFHPGALLCCNILEHITDRAAFASACAALLEPEGLMFVTVPRSYPYHLDPIDTLYRPSPRELAALFPDFELVDAAIVTDATYADDLKAEGKPVAKEVAKVLVKSALLRGGVAQSRARLHRLLWLGQPYKVTAVMLKKKPALAS